MSRHTWRFFTYEARCRDCPWETHGRNGLGNAAQHADRTGHSVCIDVEGSIEYANDARHSRLLREKGQKP